MTGTWTIAIDGPSGTGKSTIARHLARQLGADYLDTGAMYRIAALAVLRGGVDPSDQVSSAHLVQEMVFDVPLDPDNQRFLLGDDDVTEAIRDRDATMAVTPISANPAVRQVLSLRQQELALGRRIVVEGRDIGTVIAPQAELKIFLTADEGERVRRRMAQNAASSGRDQDWASVTASIQRRDRVDSTRAVAPLTAAADAVMLDTSAQDVTETLSAVMDLVTQRGLR